VILWQADVAILQFVAQQYIVCVFVELHVTVKYIVVLSDA